MANRVDGSLNNLVQGVSQQAPRDRLPGQCKEQLNCVADPVRGLSRRPPSRFISSLSGLTHDANAKIHTYDRGDQEKYIVVVTDGKVQVYDLDGTAITVTGGTSSYLDTTDARADISLHTIGDFTFISNRGVTPAKNGSNAANARLIRNGALYTLSAPSVFASQEFTIAADGTSVSYTTPSATTTDPQDFGIREIMSGLESAFTKTNYSSNYSGNTVYIYKDDEDDTTPILARVQSDNNALTVVSDVAESVADLPNLAPHGLVVKITGGTSTVDDFYMRSVHDDKNPGSAFSQVLQEAHWIEIADPDELNELDPDTMPHGLVRMPDGTFHFAPFDGVNRTDPSMNVVANPEWTDRLAGDSVTNADPSFIGEPIAGITSFQGRLVFLAGESLIASTVDDLFDFWKKSATTLIDSDRIDLVANTDQVALLRRAVQHNRNLVVFSESAQFVITGRQAFTPTNASMTQTTVFDADLNAEPAANGQNVLFGINYGNFAGVREFYTDSEFDSDNAEPITRQVERYLPGRVTNFATSTDYNAVIVTTDSSPLLFLYQYLWAGADKVQSAWSQWSLTDSVVHTFFVQSELYIVKRTDANAYYLTSVDMRDVTPTGLPANVYLDIQTVLTSTVDEVTLPSDYPISGFADLVAVQGPGCPNPGLRILITDRNGDVLTLAEDMEGGDVYVGVRYTSRYIPTFPQVKDRQGVTIGTGDLHLQQYFVTFTDTGALSLYADSIYEETFLLEEFTGRVSDALSNLLGSQPIVDDTLAVPFRFMSEEADLRVESDSWLPFRLTEIEWVGKYTKRGRRV